MRMLLNIPALQQQVATMLLQQLPEYSNSESEAAASIPSLILGQLRW
jgi:hypothetical protein